MNRRFGKLLFAILFIVIGIISITIATLAMNMYTDAPVKARVIIEAGEALPSADVFLTEDAAVKGLTASYASGVSFYDPLSPELGVFSVEIAVGRKTYPSTVVVTDTRQPAGLFVDQISFVGEIILADAFVINIADATAVTVSYDTAVDFNLAGSQGIWVCLTDAGGNKTSLCGHLTVIDGQRTLDVELGQYPESIGIEDFIFDSVLLEESWLLDGAEDLDLSVPSVTILSAVVGGTAMELYINVEDTQPPTATAAEAVTYKGTPLGPWAFVTDVYDASPITVSFKNEPNWNSLGGHPVVIVLEDSYRNKTELNSWVTVEPDQDPPEFLGLNDIYVQAGGSVAYRKDVTAWDGADGEVPFTVDSVGVDVYNPGTYTALYKATDSSGNVAEAAVSVVVTAVDPEEVYYMAGLVFADILNAEMTPWQVGKAIYEWVRNNVHYAAEGEKIDVIDGAYNAFKYHSGDCYTFYAVCKVMLDLVGIENYSLEREGGKTRHYWSLVNTGDGWYHFDSCPYKEYFNGYMFTEKQAQAYTAARGRNYYDYDHGSLPDYIEVVWGD